MAKPGRPKSRRPRMDERITVLMTSAEMEALRAYSDRHQTELSPTARKFIVRAVHGEVPLIGTVPCGPLSEALQEPEEMVCVGDALDPKPGDFLLRAKGASMEPMIHDGDYVLLRPSSFFNNGDICAVLIFENGEHEGECQSTLKRIYRDETGHCITLKADNKRFRPMEIPSERVKIAAVFRGLIRRGE